MLAILIVQISYCRRLRQRLPVLELQFPERHFHKCTLIATKFGARKQHLCVSIKFEFDDRDEFKLGRHVVVSVL